MCGASISSLYLVYNTSCTNLISLFSSHSFTSHRNVIVVNHFDGWEGGLTLYQNLQQQKSWKLPAIESWLTKLSNAENVCSETESVCLLKVDSLMRSGEVGRHEDRQTFEQHPVKFSHPSVAQGWSVQMIQNGSLNTFYLCGKGIWETIWDLLRTLWSWIFSQKYKNICDAGIKTFSDFGSKMFIDFIKMIQNGLLKTFYQGR